MFLDRKRMNFILYFDINNGNDLQPEIYISAGIGIVSIFWSSCI